MTIAEIPFNRLIGLGAEPAGSEFMVRLPAGGQYHNHLGLVHAAAQLAVAEAASGEWMLRNFGPRAVEFIAVVRRFEAKFKQPARGQIFGQATVGDESRHALELDLTTKRMVFFSVHVDVRDESGAHTLTGSVEWFITRRSAST